MKVNVVKFVFDFFKVEKHKTVQCVFNLAPTYPQKKGENIGTASHLPIDTNLF